MMRYHQPINYYAENNQELMKEHPVNTVKASIYASFMDVSKIKLKHQCDHQTFMDLVFWPTARPICIKLYNKEYVSKVFLAQCYKEFIDLWFDYDKDTSRKHINMVLYYHINNEHFELVLQLDFFKQVWLPFFDLVNNNSSSDSL